jgi:ubiquinone biosynthesis protein Coq4
MGDAAMDRSSFEGAVRTGCEVEHLVVHARAVREGSLAAAGAVGASLLHVATIAPERLADAYDDLTEGWLGRRPDAPAISGDGSAPGALPEGFFPALWAMVDDPDLGRDPADITVRTAALAGLLPDELFERVAAFAPRWPGVVEAASQGIPSRFELADLAACPADSLGGRLHSLVVDDGFDLEVLDRDALGLSGLLPPLDYLNTRILQCHDVWHEVAGYDTTGLHEIAISGFQMAQFGHHYSSMFLAMVTTTAAFTQPVEASHLLYDTVLTAYLHGRETPSMLGVAWEEIWDQPMDEIRGRLGVEPYASPYPADLLELIRNG